MRAIFIILITICLFCVTCTPTQRIYIGANKEQLEVEVCFTERVTAKSNNNMDSINVYDNISKNREFRLISLPIPTNRQCISDVSNQGYSAIVDKNTAILLVPIQINSMERIIFKREQKIDTITLIGDSYNLNKYIEDKIVKVSGNSFHRIYIINY